MTAPTERHMAEHSEDWTPTQAETQAFLSEAFRNIDLPFLDTVDQAEISVALGAFVRARAAPRIRTGAILTPSANSSGGGEQRVPHDWQPSRLGHGEQMCAACYGTNREIAVIGDLSHCPERAAALAQVQQ